MLNITKTLIATAIFYTAGALAPAPAAHAATSLADDHAACVAAFGPTDCHDIECAESFGGGCPPSGIRASIDPAEYLTMREARGAARRLILTDLRGLGPAPRLSRCHHTGDTRVVCKLTLRSVKCPSTRLVVTETADERTVDVDPFRCGR